MAIMSIPSSSSSAPANAGIGNTDIRGLKPLESFHYPPAYYVGGALILLVLAWLLVWGIHRWSRRLRSRRATPVLPPEPLDAVILRRLEKIRKDISVTTPGVPSSNILRRGYFDLSEIFRDYLEGRFNFPASDWTTEEIISYANTSDVIRYILTTTDEVKFAGRAPERDQLLSLITQVEEYVRKTT